MQATAKEFYSQKFITDAKTRLAQLQSKHTELKGLSAFKNLLTPTEHKALLYDRKIRKIARNKELRTQQKAAAAAAAVIQQKKPKQEDLPTKMAVKEGIVSTPQQKPTHEEQSARAPAVEEQDSAKEGKKGVETKEQDPLDTMKTKTKKKRKKRKKKKAGPPSTPKIDPEWELLNSLPVTAPTKAPLSGEGLKRRQELEQAFDPRLKTAVDLLRRLQTSENSSLHANENLYVTLNTIFETDLPLDTKILDKISFLLIMMLDNTATEGQYSQYLESEIDQTMPKDEAVQTLERLIKKAIKRKATFKGTKPSPEAQLPSTKIKQKLQEHAKNVHKYCFEHNFRILKELYVEQVKPFEIEGSRLQSWLHEVNVTLEHYSALLQGYSQQASAPGFTLKDIAWDTSFNRAIDMCTPILYVIEMLDGQFDKEPTKTAVNLQFFDSLNEGGELYKFLTGPFAEISAEEKPLLETQDLEVFKKIASKLKKSIEKFENPLEYHIKIVDKIQYPPLHRAKEKVIALLAETDKQSIPFTLQRTPIIESIQLQVSEDPQWPEILKGGAEAIGPYFIEKIKEIDFWKTAVHEQTLDPQDPYHKFYKLTRSYIAKAYLYMITMNENLELLQKTLKEGADLVEELEELGF